MSVNTRLKVIREENKMLQKDFAKVLSLKTRQITEIERGNQKMTIEIALDIEDKFNINMRWLLSGRGEKYLDKLKKVDSNLIFIDKSKYYNSDNIVELVYLLKDIPESLIEKILFKLKNVIQKVHEEF